MSRLKQAYRDEGAYPMVTVREISLLVPEEMILDELKPFKNDFVAKAWLDDSSINMTLPWGYCIRTHSRWKILIRKGINARYETLREETMDGIDVNVIRHMPACNLLISKKDFQAFAKAFEGINYFEVIVRRIKGRLKGHCYIN